MNRDPFYCNAVYSLVIQETCFKLRSHIGFTIMFSIDAVCILPHVCPIVGAVLNSLELKLCCGSPDTEGVKYAAKEVQL